MDTFLAWVGVAGIVITAVALLAGAFVYVRGSWSKARLEAMSRDIETYKSREDLHEREMKDCLGRVAHLEEKVETLTEENKVLKEAVTQRAAVEELRRVQAEQHHDLMGMFEQLLIAINRLEAA
jgi:predicted  nucleic acid-binding Zn-ribbon protein